MMTAVRRSAPIWVPLHAGGAGHRRPPFRHARKTESLSVALGRRVTPSSCDSHCERLRGSARVRTLPIIAPAPTTLRDNLRLAFAAGPVRSAYRSREAGEETR